MFRIIRRKKIQPIDLKKKLATAMREERRILPYGDYAPNQYIIFLNKEDANRWSALRGKTVEQLKTFLQEQIDKEGYQLEGDISVEIRESEDVEPGDVSVEAGLEATHAYRQTKFPNENWSVEETGVDNKTVEILSQKYSDVNLSEGEQKEIPKSAEEPPQNDEELPLAAGDMDVEPIEAEESEDMTFILTKMEPIAKLIVTKGEDAGKEFDISQMRVVVGRRGKQSDISLTDSSRYISRQQFEIVYDEGIFILTDLQNRTDLFVFVNDNKAAPSMILNTKDKIRLGNGKVAIVEIEFVVM